jgi:hypothetical protein
MKSFCESWESYRRSDPVERSAIGNVPEPTHGTGSAKLWRPCTPALTAGLTDHVWTLREVLLSRVPPCPQSRAV